jgi:hypothetical protein
MGWFYYFRRLQEAPLIRCSQLSWPSKVGLKNYHNLCGVSLHFGWATEFKQKLQQLGHGPDRWMSFVFRVVMLAAGLWLLRWPANIAYVLIFLLHSFYFFLSVSFLLAPWLYLHQSVSMLHHSQLRSPEAKYAIILRAPCADADQVVDATIQHEESCDPKPGKIPAAAGVAEISKRCSCWGRPGKLRAAKGVAPSGDLRWCERRPTLRRAATDVATRNGWQSYKE